MKRHLSCLMFLFIIAFCWAYDWSSNAGDGSPDNPYRISEPNHVIALGQTPAVSSGGYHFILTDDIVFDPDSDPNHLFAQAVIDSFNGVLDGQGHTIENLSIISDAEKMSHVGLFGTLEETGAIRHTGFKNVVISMPGLATPSDHIGAICGENKGLIEQCLVQGIVRGTIIMGGLTGKNHGTIDDCYMIGLVDGFGSLGGICGYNGGSNGQTGIIRRCYSSTQVKTTGFTHGALVGQYFGGELADCAWDSDVSDVTIAYTLNSGSTDEGISNLKKYTTAQMRQRQNFGFLDFIGDPNDGSEEIWRMCVDGISPPRLGWEYTMGGDFACPDGVGMEDFGTLSRCFGAMMSIDAELDDDDDQIVSLNEMARLSEYWMQSGCGCPGADITADGAVNVNDLGEMMDVWLMSERPECRITDMNRDGVIDLPDVGSFANYWLDNRSTTTD